MNTISTIYNCQNEKPTIRDFNMVCDLIEVVLVKRKSEQLSVIYEDVLGNLTTQYKELLETDMIKSKRGNWIIRNPFAEVKA